mmetsp:Transcript_66910/g.180906  ORF Transcript_66910/g.180906 Transcript_66910/m.180906 type:complete len:243 (+) Transcript_66910:559-1287(+)
MNTALFACSSLQNSTIQTSPLRMAQPCSQSRMASPCTTGTKPARTSPLAPATASAGSRELGSFFFAVPTKGHGDMVTAGSPCSIRAVMTCLLSVVTERRVFAKPSRSLPASGYASGPSPTPLDTPYSLACWWPNEPAPWMMATRLPDLCTSPICFAAAARFSACSVSNSAFLVHADPPIFTTTSAGGPPSPPCPTPAERRRSSSAAAAPTTAPAAAHASWCTLRSSIARPTALRAAPLEQQK